MTPSGTVAHSMAPVLVLHVAPRALLRILLALALLLVIGSAAARYLRWFHVPEHSRITQVLLLLDVNLEHNLPAYYAALLLLVCAGTLVLVGMLDRSRKALFWRQWMLLGAIFLVLSMDEAMEFHGHLNDPVARVVGSSGVLFYRWVLPALIFLLGLGAYLFRFLLGLPRVSAILFIASGSVYVIGAVGFEMLASLLMSNPDAEWSNAGTAAVFEHTEELLEMLGPSIFLYALLRHVKVQHGSPRIELQITRP